MKSINKDAVEKTIACGMWLIICNIASYILVSL